MSDPAALSSGDLQGRAIRGSVWTSISTLIGTPVAFLANAVVARALGVADYGRLTVLTLTLLLATQLTNFSISDGVIRWGAAAHARGERSTVDDLLRKAMGFHVLVQLPLLLAVIGILARNASLPLLAVLAISVIVPAFLGSAALCISVENKSAGGAQIALLSGLLTQGAVSLTAILSHSALSVWSVRSIAASVLLPLNFLLLDRARRRVALQLRRPTHWPTGFWKFALVTTLANVVGALVFARSEIYALQLLGSATALGSFALAFGLSQQITAPVDAMIGPLFPAVVGLLAVEPERAHAALFRATRFASLLCATITAVVIPAAYFLVPPVYGEDFRAAALLFVPLGLASCLQTLTRPLLSFTGARGRNDLFLRANLAALGVDVVLALALIPLLGAWGAVIANACGQGTALVLVAVPELRHLGVGLREWASANLSWGVSVAVAASTIAACAQVPVVGAAQALLAALLGVPLLMVALRLGGGGLSADDVSSLLVHSPRALRPAIRGIVRAAVGPGR